MKTWTRLGAAVATAFVIISLFPVTVGAASANPSGVDFGKVPLNTTATQNIAITVDAGFILSNASGAGTSPPFLFSSDTCAAFSGPGTCNVKETFAPTALGLASGMLILTECASASGTCADISIAVSGTGVSTFAAVPSSIDFGNVALNTTATQNIAITVDAGFALGNPAGVFSPLQVNPDTCANFTGPGTCNVKVSFTPTAANSVSSVLNLSECPPGFPCLFITIPLKGTGISSFVANPSTINFGNVAVGTTVTQNISITLDAGFRLSTPISPFPFQFSSDACLTFIGPGTCNAKVSLAPTAANSSSGILSLSECMPVICGPGVSVALIGTGFVPLTFATALLPSGTVGMPYSSTALQATGGTPPYTWTVTSGSLPAGIVLNSSTGTISGTPTANGTFTISITVTDSSTPTPQTATKRLAITIIGVSDLALSVSADPKPVQFSKLATFIMIVQNLGPSDASGVELSDKLPSGSQFASATSSQGSCTTPPTGSTGSMVCSLGTLANGATATVTLTVDATVRKDSISNTATLANDPNSIDPVSANNSATAVVQIK